MSHKAHEQLPTPPSCSIHSGASREASKRWCAATAAALLTLALGQVAQAADGQLDPSFGVDGRVTLRYRGRPDGSSISSSGWRSSPMAGSWWEVPRGHLPIPTSILSSRRFSSAMGAWTPRSAPVGLTNHRHQRPAACARFCQCPGPADRRGRSCWWDDRVDRVVLSRLSLQRYATRADGAVDTGFGDMGLSRHRSQVATRALLPMLRFSPTTARSYWWAW